MKNLGKLEKIPLRSVWKSESGDFTPWLAGEENISILSNAINLDLVVEGVEKDVGSFRADIICRDTVSDQRILIENQIEKTDHGHLGQVLTYAPGLDASVIVWIASKFREEHRAALDWLNDNTDEGICFFGLEVELWRIGDSQPAPKFNIVSKPNGWSKEAHSISRNIANQEVSQIKIQQKKYWQAFADFLEETDSNLKSRPAKYKSYSVFSVGKSGMHLTCALNTRKNWLCVEIYFKFKDSQKYFYSLKEEKDNIKAEIGEALSWEELPGKKSSRIAIYKNNITPLDESDWNNQHRWLAKYLEKFNLVFRERLQKIS